MFFTLTRKLAAGLMLLTLGLCAGVGWLLWNVNGSLDEKSQRGPTSLGPSSASTHEGGAEGGEAAEGAKAEEGEGGGHAAAGGADDVADDSSAVVDFDEMLFSLESPKGAPHSLVLKMDLELFESNDKETIQKQRSGIKNCLIELMADQKFENLKTLSGKLLFKEQLVGRLNTYLNRPVIRDVQLSNFILR